MTFALLLLLASDPCLVLASECRELVSRCNRGEGFSTCARARACISRYERECGKWWAIAYSPSTC